MADEKSHDGGGINVPFVFVRHGDPAPADWMARHPGWVKFPATLVPRPATDAGMDRDNSLVRPESTTWPGSVPVSHGAPVRRRRPVPVHHLPAPGQHRKVDPIEAYRQAEAVFASIGGTAGHHPAASHSSVTSNSRMQASKSIQDFIYTSETRGHPDRVAHLHWPGAASGVTLGAGYDMKERSPASIIADLESIGVDAATAKRVANAGGVGPERGKAKAYAEAHAQDITLTEPRQRALLSETLSQYEVAVRRLVQVPLNQNQFDALVSFAYARGPGRLAGIANMLNADNFAGAAKTLEHYDDGGVNHGLASRRRMEAALFRRPA